MLGLQIKDGNADNCQVMEETKCRKGQSVSGGNDILCSLIEAVSAIGILISETDILITVMACIWRVLMLELIVFMAVKHKSCSVYCNQQCISWRHAQ